MIRELERVIEKDKGYTISRIPDQVEIINKVNEIIRHLNNKELEAKIKKLKYEGKINTYKPEFNTKVEWCGMTYYLPQKTCLFHRIMMRLFFGIKVS